MVACGLMWYILFILMKLKRKKEGSLLFLLEINMLILWVEASGAIGSSARTGRRSGLGCKVVGGESS